MSARNASYLGDSLTAKFLRSFDEHRSQLIVTRAVGAVYKFGFAIHVEKLSFFQFVGFLANENYFRGDDMPTFRGASVKCFNIPKLAFRSEMVSL